MGSAADDGHQFLGHGLAQFKHKVFCRCRFYGQHGRDDADAVDLFDAREQHLLCAFNGLRLEPLKLFAQLIVLADEFLYRSLEVLGVVEHGFQIVHGVGCGIDGVFASLACQGFNAADARSNTAF